MRSVSRYLSRAVLGAVLLASPWALQAQDAGDTCDTAGEILIDGSYNFDTSFATGNDPCFAGPPTVFYQWTAPSDGIATVDLCGSTYDTYLTVLTFTTCPASCANFVGDNDDFCGAQSSVTFNAISGTKYLFVVSGFDVPDAGAGVLNFAFTPLSGELGDTCTDPFVITGDGDYPFDTTGASPNEPCLFNVASPTVWFQYEATAIGTVYATLCSGGIAQYDSTLIGHITDGTCPVSCATAVDGTDGCGALPGEFGIEFVVEPGDVVYYTVSGWGAADFGEGVLTFSFTPAALVAGETCEEAPALPESGVYVFSNNGVLAGGDPCRPDSPTVWYSFTAPIGGDVLVETCDLTGMDTFLSAFNGSCPVACEDLIVSDDDFCGVQSQITFPVVQGETYLIAISGFDEDEGNGRLLFEFTPDDPLLIELESFSASASGVGQTATILWSTSSEIDNVGFHVNRVRFQNGAASPAGRVNPALIPAQGSPNQGASYSLVDPLPVAPGEQRGYVLVDIDANGNDTRHGPIRLEVGGQPSGEPDWSLY